MEDLLLLDLVHLELPELVDFDPIFEDVFDECPCSTSAFFSQLPSQLPWTLSLNVNTLFYQLL